TLTWTICCGCTMIALAMLPCSIRMAGVHKNVINNNDFAGFLSIRSTHPCPFRQTAGPWGEIKGESFHVRPPRQYPRCPRGAFPARRGGPRLARPDSGAGD